MPVQGIGLPKSYAFVELDDPETFQDTLRGLSEKLAEELSDVVQIRTREYRDALSRRQKMTTSTVRRTRPTRNSWH